MKSDVNNLFTPTKSPAACSNKRNKKRSGANTGFASDVDVEDLLTVFSVYRSGVLLFGRLVTKVLPALLLLFQVSSCVSGKIKDEGVFPDYQKTLVERGPQKRRGSEGLDALRPAADPRLPALKEIKDSAGKTTINLTLKHAVSRALANSPEIMAVSFDPSIATENVAVEASKFDVTTFGKLEFNDKDSPSNSVSEIGKSRSSLWDVGLKQKGITGAEWRLSYAMTHTVDESISRVFARSYEPSLTFTVKQPLLRDAWPDVNLAGVTTAKLNYKIALADFRRQTEDVLSQVISLYWTLLQSRREVEIQKDLLDKAVETLTKIEYRKGIDATMGDINQAEAAVKRREAALMDAKKWLFDVQDSLVRLLGDSQMNLIDALDIVPTTAPDTEAKELVQSELLQLALTNNSEIARARLEVEVAKINLKVAKRQKMPLVDMVASAQLDGLSDDQGTASRMISGRDHRSYFLGVTFEYPLGNREKRAEFRQRELQHAKASSKLQALLDQIAVLVKEKIRFAKTAQREIQVYKDAVNSAKIHLQVIEDIGVVRKRLTPEFLLTVIQAQESLADAQRAEIKAIADYNIALLRLAQATGMVLNLEYIKQNTLRLVTKYQ